MAPACTACFTSPCMLRIVLAGRVGNVARPLHMRHADDQCSLRS